MRLIILALIAVLFSAIAWSGTDFMLLHCNANQWDSSDISLDRNVHKVMNVRIALDGSWIEPEPLPKGKRVFRDGYPWGFTGKAASGKWQASFWPQYLDLRITLLPSPRVSVINYACISVAHPEWSTQ